MSSVGGWKLLTARTLREWLTGDGAQWHMALGEPILRSAGLRGSALLLLQPAFLACADSVVWWSVADTGGVRAGLSPLPAHLATDLPQPREVLRELLETAAQFPEVANAVNRHTPLPQWFAAQVLPRGVQQELRRCSYDPYSWMHEVVLDSPPPVSASTVAELIVPNVMRRQVQQQLPRVLWTRLRSYNPALGVESALGGRAIEVPASANAQGEGPEGLWCIGAYESRSAGHFPFHAAPVVARRHLESWRRERYAIAQPYRLIPAGGDGPRRPLEGLSVRQGDYISVDPTPISSKTQVVAVAPGEVVCFTGVLPLLRGLARGLSRSHGGRAGYLRGSLLTLLNVALSRCQSWTSLTGYPNGR